MIVLCDEVTCVVCGHTGQFPSIGHWEAEGPWGLDGRPPEPLISHLELLLQTCPDCGYSADFVGLAAPGVAQIVRSDAYQALRLSGEISQGGLGFLLQAHIAESQGEIINAAWLHIHAAWQFERYGNDLRSQDHRLLAVDLLKRAALDNMDACESTGVVWLLCCDLLRRAGCLEEAREAAILGLDMGPGRDDETALRYELKLIDDGDRSFRDSWDAFGRTTSSGTTSVLYPEILRARSNTNVPGR